MLQDLSAAFAGKVLEEAKRLVVELRYIRRQGQAIEAKLHEAA